MGHGKNSAIKIAEQEEEEGPQIYFSKFIPPPPNAKNISDIPTLFAKEKQRVACMILQGAEASQLQEGGCTCASVQGQQLQVSSQ